MIRNFRLPTIEENKTALTLDRQELILMLKSVSYARSVNEERYVRRCLSIRVKMDYKRSNGRTTIGWQLPKKNLQLTKSV